MATRPPLPLQCGDPLEFSARDDDPTFIATNHTGCCLRLNKWVPGVCDACKHNFACPAAVTGDEFKWGAAVAIIVNIIISVGTALQKQAHKQVEQRVAQSAKLSEEAAALAREKTFIHEKLWWVGFSFQVGGEIGNLVAYGDPNTPSSVVAALGCMAVIANSVISAVFLGEGCRRRDVFGVILIIVGVILIIEFVPHDPDGGTRELLPCPIAFINNYSAPGVACELPATWPLHKSRRENFVSGAEACEANGLLAVGSDYWYLIQPVWLAYLGVMIACFAFLYVALQRFMQAGTLQHCASLLALADIMGGFTVCASVTVSTFLFNKLIGHGKWHVLAEPVFWLCVLVLVLTLPIQVYYFNKALAEYDASLVMPTHYVLFTLASIGAPSVLYQELTLDPDLLAFHSPVLMVGLFVVGIGLTCAGVLILSKGKELARMPLVEEVGMELASVRDESRITAIPDHEVQQMGGTRRASGPAPASAAEDEDDEMGGGGGSGRGGRGARKSLTSRLSIGNGRKEAVPPRWEEDEREVVGGGGRIDETQTA